MICLICAINPNNGLIWLLPRLKTRFMMVESEAYELSEDEMLGAITFAHNEIQAVIDLILDMKKEAGKPAFEFKPADDADLYKTVKKAGEASLRKAFANTDKQERVTAIHAARADITAGLSDADRDCPNLDGCLKKLEAEIVRGDTVKNGKRIDGRDLVTVRQIESETRLLPRTHGSALFTRGETQSLVVTTLGNG